jgi:hypothetical protein
MKVADMKASIAKASVIEKQSISLCRVTGVVQLNVPGAVADLTERDLRHIFMHIYV